MNLIDQKLSSLKKGDRVHFTQKNGQIIDGIVVENDKKETLSVQITALTTLKYEQIAMIEEQLGNIPVLRPVPVDDEVETPEKPVKKIEIASITSGKDAIATAFKAMDSDEKKILTPSYDKCQSSFKSHEIKKCEEAVTLVWNLMGKKGWDFNPRVNRYYANIQLVLENDTGATKSFFYAKDTRSAYLTAYHGALKRKSGENEELYKLASVFSAIYLTEGSSIYLEESAEVLRKASSEIKDISGVVYALNSKECTQEARDQILRIVRLIGFDCGLKIESLSDFEKNLQTLRYRYPMENVIKEIREHVSEMAQSILSDEETDIPDVDFDDTEEFPIIGKNYFGTMMSYNIFEKNGKIVEGSTQFQCEFELKSVQDISLSRQLTNLSSSKDFSPISIIFQIEKKFSKYVAVAIRRGYGKSNFAEQQETPVEADTANKLYSEKRYEDAIEAYRQRLGTEKGEDAFAQIITCYLALWNANGDENGKYRVALENFVGEYLEDSFKQTKTLEVLQQYYMKVQNYSQCISVLNTLIESCGADELGRTLQYLSGKERCYRILKDYPSAISQLLDWLDIVERNKLKDRYKHRDTVIYVELAEVYLENGEYENAEKYAKRISPYAKLKEVLKEIEKAKKNEQEEDFDTIEEAIVEEEPEQEFMAEESTETLLEAFGAYQDTDGFDALNMTDEDVLRHALSFNEKHLDCLLTYLKAASMLAVSSTKKRVTKTGVIVSASHAISALEKSFSYAFNSPLSENSYISTEIISAFQETSSLIPELNDKLMIASSMTALFNHTEIMDYTIEDLRELAENSEISQQFPTMVALLEELCDFRTMTGCGMDIFADYRTSDAVIEKVIEEAKACATAVAMKNEVYESQGQVRRMRELMFSPERSPLSECLAIVAENQVARFAYVRDTISELFIRNDRPVSMEHVENKKIDEFIDNFWDEARDLIQSEKRHISRPYDKLKGGKRNNIVLTIKKMLTCICEWLSVAEHFSRNDNAFAKEKYREIAPRVKEHLNAILGACEWYLSENGFDWGNEAIRRVTKELLAKMDGTYDARTRKYMFIDFLSGEEILLNEKYLPELQSTFCGWENFNILYRIERHAGYKHLSWKERISEIMSEIETKHNFRSAMLIKAYGEDMGISEIAEHKDFAQFNDCLKQAKKRFETVYEDFNDEVSLHESHGRISNINGAKDNILKLAFDWYRITKLTNDFGFYVRILDIMRNKIALDSAEKGERLTKQLEELADKPEYDFGDYDKSDIAAYIQDQDYTIAEFILNRIRSGDTSRLAMNYVDEPFNYFNGFMSEHATNYRVSCDAKINLELAITKYAGKKNIEIALKHLTNNARKDVKGGCHLINHWILRTPAGTERIEKLLNDLGFTNCQVSNDTGNSEDSYVVLRKKQTGKVNYSHPIPAFGSLAEEEGFRVLCLYGRFDCNRLMDMFRTINTAAKHTIVFLDYALNQDERRKLARKIKEEKSFAKCFIVVDRVVLLYLAKHYATNTVNRMLMAVTMPFAYYQPFVENSSQTMPPELFTGREDELTKIESADGANLVYGGRQLGKSALLKMAQRNIDKNSNGDRAVLLEIKDLDYTAAAKVVSNKLIVVGILDESCRCDDWDILAGHLEKRLMDENPETRINYLLLMLDEADEFIRTSVKDGNRPVSALKNLPSNRFKLVMAGLHNLSRYNREAMMHNNSNLIHLQPKIVRPFRHAEAVKLLTYTLAYLGFRFNEKIVSLILAKTNYFPGLIQLYCQKLLEAMKNDDYAGYNEINTPYYEVTENHFKKVLSDKSFMEKVNEKLEITLFVEEAGHSNYHIIALILSYLYYTAPNEKGYTIEDIMNVANDYNIVRMTNIKREQLEELLSEMWDLNVLSLESGRYRFATESFRELLGSQEEVEQSMNEYIEEGGKA